MAPLRSKVKEQAEMYKCKANNLLNVYCESGHYYQKRGTIKVPLGGGGLIVNFMSPWIGHGTQFLINYLSPCYCEGIIFDVINI